MSQTAEKILNEEASKTDFSTKYKSAKVKKTLLSPFFQLVADITAICISYSLQYYLIYFSDIFSSANRPDIAAFITTGAVWICYWLIFFFFSGLYKNWYIRSPFDELFTLLKVVFFGCAIITFTVFISTQQQPRFSFLLYFLNFTILVTLGRFVARRLQKKLREKKIIAIPSLIIGTKKEARELYKKTISSPAWGFKTIGIAYLDDDKQIADSRDKEISIPEFNGVDSIPEVLEQYNPEEVLITTGSQNHDLLLKIVSYCAEKDIIVKIQPDMYNIFSGQSKTLHIYGIPLIEISSQLLKPWQESLKRIIDIVFSALVLILGSPIWILLSIAIKLESRGPIFYSQPRVGKGGKTFMVHKFRSMVSGADKKGKTWTEVNDPRVTKLGKITRKTHLDEIPQFWNALKGEMSIVGPRPEQPQFVEEYGSQIPYYMRRLKVRPGITGWWQVKYQPHVLDKEELESRLKDDFYYIENMSLKLDIEIIIRTIWCVIRGHGQA